MNHIINEMLVRGYTPKVIEAYLDHIDDFQQYAGKDIRHTDVMDVQSYVSFMLHKNMSEARINSALVAIKFYYKAFNNIVPEIKLNKPLLEVA
jgi:site-specific recombinase XerD